MWLKLLVLAAAIDIIAGACRGCGRGTTLEGLAVGMWPSHEDVDELTVRSVKCKPIIE